MQSRLSTIIITVFTFLILSFSQVVMSKEVSLKQKIGQMLLFGFKGTELTPNDPIVKYILAQQVGGVILFDYDAQSKTFDRNIKSPDQLRHLTEQLQAYTQEAAKNHKNHLYPLFISIDYEGGIINRLKESYGFPYTVSAAQLGQGSLANAESYAEQMATTLENLGININFAPVLDVNVNPDNPIIAKKERSFSSDPTKVATFAEIFAKAYQKHHVICVYKHFPGHGSSTGDTHLGLVDVTQTWKEYELDPYKALLGKSDSCPMVMTAHVVHYGLDSKGYPASLSYAMTTGLLRDKLNFDGVVVTDALQMKAITDNYGLAEALILAINAGADILVFDNQLSAVPEDAEQLVNMIYEDVKTGKIPKSRIEASYKRIMKLKAGL